MTATEEISSSFLEPSKESGSEAVLSTIIRKEAKLGLVFLDATRAAKAVEGML